LHLLSRFLDDIAETFAKSNRLSSAAKHDLQNHLALRVLEEQGLNGVVINHPFAVWKSLVMLNQDLMVLVFN
jgi:predicted xylose isomerase-like sugar epimerase